MTNHVRIVEVGPRDGLQNEAVQLDVATKVELIQRLQKCGLETIEAGAFVSPKWVPQMADTDAVLAALNLSTANYPVLVPNEKGYDLSIAAGVKEIAVFTAASEQFTLKNINATIAESFERFAPVMARAKADGVRVRGYVSTVVGCPYAGKISPAQVVPVARKLLDMGCYEISLGDTIGVGTPKSFKAMLKAVMTEVPVEKLAVHCHDTYGQAIANIAASLELGVRVVDSAVGGLGGCPYAPGAGGNVATEDVLYHLHEEGFDTGVDLAEVVRTAVWINQKLNRKLGSKVGQALVGKGL